LTDSYSGHQKPERSEGMTRSATALRVSLTYVIPTLAVLYVVVAGLWLVPDGLSGMYGNFDGRFFSWSARGILEWGEVLDFSPFSPLVGTGSLFAPFLPWLNLGALALAIPAPLPLQHLASMLIYLAELSIALYLLYRYLEFSREQSLLATMLYVGIFFIPFPGFTWALPWYGIFPMSAHLIAAMNVATIALIRVASPGRFSRAIFALLFLGALFVAFASAPVNSLTYVPTYGMLWLALLIPFRDERRAVIWRVGTIAFTLLILALIGVPSYLAATAATSARAADALPMFHPGWQLLSPAYWQDVLSTFPLCEPHLQLMCPTSIIGWFEIVVLAGAVLLACGRPGIKRRYGVVINLLVSILVLSVKLTTDSWLGAYGQHSLSHVGVLSAGATGRHSGRKHRCGLAGRATVCGLGMDACDGELPVRCDCYRRVAVVHPAIPAAPAGTGAARLTADRPCGDEAGSDHRLSAT
jgi:hypothetical protein